MAEKVGAVYVEIGAMMDGFNRSLDQARSRTEQLDNEFKRMSQNVARVGAVFATIAGAVGTAAVAYNRLIKPAAAAAEQVAKFNAIFGQQAAGVVGWADQLGQSLGRSSRELQGMAADMMALVQPMAGSREAAIQMSEGLVQMAQDLSAFHDVDVREAFVALRSGISGETEPMKRFGVLLTETALQEFALTQGIQKRVSQMSTAELTQLRYNAMLEKMGVATGAAERESGGLTNQLRALDGALDDNAVRIGGKMLPGMTKLVSATREAVQSGSLFTSVLEGGADAANTMTEFVANLVTIYNKINSVGKDSAFLQGLLKVSDVMNKLYNPTSALIQGIRNLNTLFGSGTSQVMSYRNAINAVADSIANTQRQIVEQGAARASAAARKFAEEQRRAYQAAADYISEVVYDETELILYHAELRRQELNEQARLELLDKQMHQAALVALEQETQQKLEDIAREARKRKEDEDREAMFRGLSTAASQVSQLGALFSMYYSNRSQEVTNRTTAETEALDAKYAADKARLESEITDAGARAAALKALDEQYARDKKAIDDKAAKDKAKLEREAAKRQKVIATFETILAIPHAAFQAYNAMVRIPFVGPLLAAAAAASATALGLAKLKLIQDTPLPAAAAGMYAETPAIFGEAGPELAFPLSSDRGRAAIALLAEGVVNAATRAPSQAPREAVVTESAVPVSNHFTIMLGSHVLFDDISDGTENGQIRIHRRAVI